MQVTLARTANAIRFPEQNSSPKHPTGNCSICTNCHRIQQKIIMKWSGQIY